MRNYFFLAVGLLLFIASCKNESPEEMLVGEWSFSDVQYERQIPEDYWHIIQEQLKPLRESYKLEYNSDGTYYSHSITHEEGEWKLENEGKKLIHTFEKGTQEYMVLILTKDSLHLKTTLQDETLTLKFIPSSK